MQHRGGCHCGAIQFTFESTPDVTVYSCTCSICRMDGFQHLIIPASQFQLIQGEPSLYTFNSGIAQHYFCSTCGIKSYYIPRSNPDGVSVNYRCVDKSTFGDVPIESFDGENWEAHAHTLEHLA